MDSNYSKRLHSRVVDSKPQGSNNYLARRKNRAKRTIGLLSGED